MYLIEKNIPLTMHANAKYPLANMSVGDSFLVPAPARYAVSRAVSVWGKRHGQKFRTRLQPDGSVRVWRIA